MTVLMTALGMTLAGCGSGAGGETRTGAPVRFATPPAPHERIDISASGRQVLAAARWPDACTYLSDDDIRAILPQATKFRRTPRKTTVIDFWDSGSADDPANVAKAGGCLTRFWLKGVTIQDVTSGIRVSTEAVAGPRLIAREYAKERKNARTKDNAKVRNYGAKAGPAGCYSVTDDQVDADLTCRQGPLLYTLTGIGYGDMGVPDTNTANRDAWLAKVLLPAAKTIAAKIA